MDGIKKIAGRILLTGLVGTGILISASGSSYVSETRARISGSMDCVRPDDGGFAKFILDEDKDGEADGVRQYHWPCLMTVGCPYLDRDPNFEEKELFRNTLAAYQERQ